MTVLSVVGVTVIACFTAVLLKKDRPEMAIAVSLVAGGIFLFAALTILRPLISEMKALLEKTDAGSYLPIVLKSLGICLMTQLAADTCRDAGETALATRCETAGKVLLLAASMPLFRQVLEISLSMMQVAP